MKNKKITIFLIIISIFIYSGIVNVEAKTCYQYTKKENCNNNSSCKWVDKKCRVKSCSTLSTASDCGSSSDEDKNNCGWTGSSCCPNGKCNNNTKSCYQYTKKKNCNLNANCKWVDKKCRVKSCSTLTTASDCGSSSDKNKNNCGWTGNACCANGKCSVTITEIETKNCKYSLKKISSSDTPSLNYTVSRQNGKVSGISTIKTKKGQTSSQVILVDFDPNYFVDSNGKLYCPDIVVTGDAQKISEYIKYDETTKKVEYKCPGASGLDPTECAKMAKEQFETSYIYGLILYFAHRDGKLTDEQFKKFDDAGQQTIYFVTTPGKMHDIHSGGAIEANTSVKKTKEERSYDNFNDSNIKYAKCGSLDRIPLGVPAFTNNVFTLVKVLVPIVLVLLGMIDFARAVVSGNEDKMRESTKRFVRRIAGGLLVFFVLALTQFLVEVSDPKEESDMLTCIKCFIVDDDKCGSYNQEAVSGNSSSNSSSTSTNQNSSSTTVGSSGKEHGGSSGGF